MESNGLIYGKISQIMKECPAIGKNNVNQQQKFSYRSIDDVMNALQNILPKYGVFYVPEVIESSREERTTKTGGNLIYSVLKVKYTFYAEDGSHVCAVVQSEGMDSADKSSNKAMSAACKYALFQVFNIPTVEFADPDAETPEPSVKTLSKKAILKKFSLPKNFTTDLTLEEAKGLQSQSGLTYGQMSIEDLFELLEKMVARVNKNNLNEAQKTEIMRRISAIYLIFDFEKNQCGY